jgi:hypothetical protein
MVDREREWISVACAASMMGVCHRQALRLLTRRNAELEGRLLRRVGEKRMPGGVQASKYLVSLTVMREAMRADGAERDIESLRLEVAMLRSKLAAICRAVRPLLRPESVPDGT